MLLCRKIPWYFLKLPSNNHICKQHGSIFFPWYVSSSHLFTEMLFRVINSELIFLAVPVLLQVCWAVMLFRLSCRVLKNGWNHFQLNSLISLFHPVLIVNITSILSQTSEFWNILKLFLVLLSSVFVNNFDFGAF